MTGYGEARLQDERWSIGVEVRTVNNRHLKLKLRAASGEVVDAIAFRYLDGADAPEIRPNDRVQVAYRTSIDDYTGTRRLQLVTEWVGKV